MQPIAQLALKGQPWYADGHWFAPWTERTKALLSQVTRRLYHHLQPYLSPCCTHIKGHGGVKGTVRWLTRKNPSFHYVARFDVASYYSSMHHNVILDLLEELVTDRELQTVVHQYLTIPDTHNKGIGMVAGGSLSPLLGALYLLPLDKAMEQHLAGGKVFYVRYMDDILILAKKRWHFRSAVKTLYHSIQPLGLEIHRQKKFFIGRIEKGYDFLGYLFNPARKLRPSAESLRRLAQRANRLKEQGSDVKRLWLYVKRWTRWLWSGLRGEISVCGGTKKYLVFVLKQLQIKGISIRSLHPTVL